MNSSQDKVARVDQLLARLVERPLSDRETAEWQSLLRESPDALDRYLDHCEVETWLAAAGGSLATPALPAARSTAPTVVVRKSTGRVLPWAAAAACLALAGAIFFSPENPPASPPIAAEISPPTTLSAADPVLPRPDMDDPSPAAAPRDPWKVINATGAVNHPGLTDKPVPTLAADRPVKFNRDIRPILSETCFHCHGPDEHGRRADLRLDLADGATADLGGYQAIVPGDVEKSEAWLRVIADDPDELMPPPESHLVLAPEQKALLKRWIEEGAPYEGHWAYQPPVRTAAPATAIEGGRNEIDAFVFAQLEAENLAPSPQADPRTLLRRLTLDLTGLPPTLEESRAFVADFQTRGEPAWQDAITRLLDSPHFGERMATPWLDQARYADTNGYSIDGGRDAWLWRDWVIQAYRENAPFDRFLTEQIAGDLLPDATEAEIVATGFNRNHMITHEGGTIPEENLTNYTADRVKTTSEVFLGLTMACAQCHDHKYDPISIREYYEFFSFFNELDDRGLDGNAGLNAVPRIMAKTVIPADHELPALKREIAETREALAKNDAADFARWQDDIRAREARRGEGFRPVTPETLDVSSPNRPGPYSIQADGSILLTEPSKGLNAFSHVLRLPADAGPVTGVRIRILPHGEEKKLTPHPDGVPKITTVLISADRLPAAQVDIHKQLTFSQATASSDDGENLPAGVLDERNLHWWQPAPADGEPHLTLTFGEPVDPAATPFLSVMIFYGRSDSLPYRWRIEGFTGHDTDSVFDPATVPALAKTESERSPEEQERVLTAYRRHAPGLERTRVRLANLEDRLAVLTQAHPAMVMNTAAKPRVTHILDRGQYDAPLEAVSSNTPRVLPPLTPDDTAKATRLDLARWMTHPDHPLTARVAVNRIWALFFGTGIVSTTADFGSQGAWPSHPELLDWLAVDFIESGWDQKALIRKIVTSTTYRQDSVTTPELGERDPNNRLLARGPRFRLPAEFIRDQALALSGLLVPRVGGPSVQPYQPPGLWKEVSHFGSTPATKQVFVQDRGEKLHRRSLYTIVKRTSPHPAMAAFDAPNREMCTTERGVTNTPLQALVTLNDPQFAEAARVFAGRLLRNHPDLDDQSRLRLAFETVTGRPPADADLSALDSFLADELRRYTTDPAAATALISVGESPVLRDLDPSRQAAWTQIATLLFNLSETLTRS